MDRRTDQQTYIPVEMHFYISGMFLGLPDDIFEENPSFKKKTLYGRTDGRTDRRTDQPTDQQTDKPSYRDAWTHLKIKNSNKR